jgi:hypothetical protein
MKNFFRSPWSWLMDVVLLYVVACLITPADLYSALVAFVLLAAIWFPVRFYLARRLRE